MKTHLVILALATAMFLVVYLFRDEEEEPLPTTQLSPIHFTSWRSVEHVPNYHFRALTFIEPNTFYYWQTSHVPRFIGDGLGRYDIRGTYQESETHLKLQSEFGDLIFEKIKSADNIPLLKRTNALNLAHSLAEEGWILEQGYFGQIGDFESSGLPESWANHPLKPLPPPNQ